ncbi:sigma-70 family RNA polymerase sigma factor [Phytohabitans houttuyneae]|uniref:sigma-70 family RNA polymerase sigma factor n=1 Tax=Phytohabitans houttuyneae TaxID=1076126 RepID=UPI00280BC586|nr:sigma-70 family RNA polymerase sigma factor [Phytohabitans houttuyneae]
MTDVLVRARAGDGEAFRELVEPYRRELQVHCYRMLGSVQDAEDLLQETLLAAWRGLGGFAGRSTLRTWLYRIATNRCLNALRAGDRRIREAQPRIEVDLPQPTLWAEPSWLEPYPDALLDGVPDTAPGPDARYERKEAISLAFVAAMQSLPPRQRAVLVLRDVLGFRASEVAETLGTTEDSVTSALKRARAALATALPAPSGLPDDQREREVAARFAEAFEGGDVDAIVGMLTDDAWLRMPPLPLEYQGHAAIHELLRTVAFRGIRRYRLVPTRANGQPAFGSYLYDAHSPTGRAHGLLVVTVAGDRVSEFTRFVNNSLLGRFGLPRTLP